MTTLEKLDKLYANMKMLHPLSKILIKGFVETKKRQLRKPDAQYVEDVYKLYFPNKESKS